MCIILVLAPSHPHPSKPGKFQMQLFVCSLQLICKHKHMSSKQAISSQHKQLGPSESL